MGYNGVTDTVMQIVETYRAIECMWRYLEFVSVYVLQRLRTLLAMRHRQIRSAAAVSIVLFMARRPRPVATSNKEHHPFAGRRGAAYGVGTVAEGSQKWWLE